MVTDALPKGGLRPEAASMVDAWAIQQSGMSALFRTANLTPIQRRIAQCLLEHPDEAAFMSSPQIAGLAGVSQPSVTRFAAALGFGGYTALRREFQRLATAAPRAARAARDGNEWQVAAANEITNLRSLAEDVRDRDDVTRAARSLMQSSPLPIVGLRAGAYLATYLEYFAAKIHQDTRLLTAGGSLLLDRLEQAKEAGATAALFAVLPRYPEEVLHVLRSARALGLTIVAITGSRIGPVNEDADITLAAPSNHSLVFDSHAAPLVLASILVDAMCDAGGADCQRRLERFEDSARRRSIFHRFGPATRRSAPLPEGQ